jgi:uncharacterized protein (DUF58 family)
VPAPRLLAAIALWTGSCVFVVVWPALWLPAAVSISGLALLALWDWSVLRSCPLLIRREPPERAHVGRVSEVVLVVCNRGRTRLRVEASDQPASDLGEVEPFFRAGDLQPGCELRLRYSVVPQRRGDRPFGRAVALASSQLGLVQRRVLLDGGEPLAVYPDTTRFLRAEGLNPRYLLSVLGVKEAVRRGEGTEFDSLRDYVAGDDPRHIHWAASARRGRPVVRRNRHEHNHDVVVAVDCSRLMGSRVGERTKLDHAVDAALALAYVSLSCGDRVSLLAFDRQVRGCWARRGQRGDFAPLLELMRRVEPSGVEPDYGRLVREIAAAHKQQALVVVLTDFVEVAAAALIDPLAILARRHRSLLVAVRDRVYQAWEADESDTRDALALYRRLVLDDLLRERETALGKLRRHGFQTLDLPPAQMTAPVLNRYLALRYGGRA